MEQRTRPLVLRGRAGLFQPVRYDIPAIVAKLPFPLGRAVISDDYLEHGG